MVSSFNKWFFLPAFPLLLLIGGKKGLQEVHLLLPSIAKGLPTAQQGAGGPHPFHVSVVEIEHNAADKILEISCKIFTDDFETILAKNYNTKTDLTNPPNNNKAAMDSLVKKYINSHLSLKVNGKAVSFEYVGYEVEKEAAYGYIQVDNISLVSKIDVNNSILYDKFDDQMNIMHVKANGDRKSYKLNYPDKETTFSF